MDLHDLTVSLKNNNQTVKIKKFNMVYRGPSTLLIYLKHLGLKGNKEDQNS